MKLRRVVPVLAAVLMAMSGSARGAVAETTISVNVVNNYDKPVNNAAVILDFLGSHQITKLGKRRQVHWEARTDLHGVAKFPPVPQGTLQLQVVAKDYQTFGDKYEIDSADKSIDVKLHRPQSQYSAHPPLKPSDPAAPSSPPQN